MKERDVLLRRKILHHNKCVSRRTTLETFLKPNHDIKARYMYSFLPPNKLSVIQFTFNKTSRGARNISFLSYSVFVQRIRIAYRDTNVLIFSASRELFFFYANVIRGACQTCICINFLKTSIQSLGYYLFAEAPYGKLLNNVGLRGRWEEGKTVLTGETKRQNDMF